jgi:phosphoserine phosphatase RsbU/P
MNPPALAGSPLVMARSVSVQNHAGGVYQLACMELQGGNRAAVYQAELPGFDAWVSCRPLPPAARGGDLYYMSVCSNASISRVTIADVAGHGESVSEVAERLRDAMREHADHWDQSALIRQLNDGFLGGVREGKYATAFLLSHCASTGEVLFSNAGHPPPLWRRASRGEWTFLQDETPYSKEIADLPLGMIPGTAYRQTAVAIEPGDLLVLYTDGVNESFDGQGRQLGLERLLEMAEGLPAKSAMEAGSALLEAVKRFRGGTPPSDDETVVALHCRAGSVAPNI